MAEEILDFGFSILDCALPRGCECEAGAAAPNRKSSSERSEKPDIENPK
jgi:hypothetical protein